MNRDALNYRRVYEAKRQHDIRCTAAAYALAVSPFDLERLGWDEGERIAGLTVQADERQQPETFRVICERDRPRPTGIEETVEHISDIEREREEVLAIVGRWGDDV